MKGIKMKNKNYIALLEFDKDTGKYGVVIPDVPGFTTVGDSYDDAIRNATEGLASHLGVMKEYGEEVPDARSLEEIRSKWDGWKYWTHDVKDFLTALVPIVPLFGTQKVLVSMDSGLVARIDRISKNRSAFLSSAAEYMLENNHIEKYL
jgi:predicted RNase H-like HicB family nuclease